MSLSKIGEETLKKLINRIGHAVIVVDGQLIIQAMNNWFDWFTFVPCSQQVGTPLVGLLKSLDEGSLTALLNQGIESGNCQMEVTHNHLSDLQMKDGRMLESGRIAWLTGDRITLENQIYLLLEIDLLVDPLTTQTSMDASLLEHHYYQAAIFESARESMVAFDYAGTISIANHSFSTLFECEAPPVGAKIFRFIPSLFSSLEPEGFHKRLLSSQAFELVGFSWGGDKIDLDCSFSRLDIAGSELVFASIRDNRERQKQKAELVRLAKFDLVTGLLNRSSFKEEVQKTLNRSKRYDQKFSILFLDIDRFKMVNDAFGQEFGDEALRNFGHRLGENIRESDSLARLGVDQFAIILDLLNGFEDAKFVAKKILKQISQPFMIQAKELALTACIGISNFPGDGDDADTLIKHAEAAVGESKQLGRSKLAFYDAHMNERFSHYHEMEARLQVAVEKNHLVPFYQPQIDLKTKTLVGVESLIRWIDPDQGMVMPGEFIPVAEESGLIIDLGRISFLRGCCDYQEFANMGLGKLKIAINLSPKQFVDQHLIKFIQQVLRDNNMLPEHLTVEITEGHVVDSRSKHGIEILSKLKEIGIQVAIDDFGTGYSSFGYLKQLPVDIVKIDRVLVDGSESDRNSAFMLSGVIDIIHGLGMSVVAEGIENQAQADILSKEGCELGQGFFYGRPMKKEDLVNWYQEFRTQHGK